MSIKRMEKGYGFNGLEYVCPECGQLCKTWGRLKSHIRRKHRKKTIQLKLREQYKERRKRRYDDL